MDADENEGLVVVGVFRKKHKHKNKLMVMEPMMKSVMLMMLIAMMMIAMMMTAMMVMMISVKDHWRSTYRGSVPAVFDVIAHKFIATAKVFVLRRQRHHRKLHVTFNNQT